SKSDRGSEIPGGVVASPGHRSAGLSSAVCWPSHSCGAANSAKPRRADSTNTSNNAADGSWDSARDVAAGSDSPPEPNADGAENPDCDGRRLDNKSVHCGYGQRPCDDGADDSCAAVPATSAATARSDTSTSTSTSSASGREHNFLYVGYQQRHTFRGGHQRNSDQYF